MKIERIPIPTFGDERGIISAIEFSKLVPFSVKRIYYMYGNKYDAIRGCHAHKILKQLIICLHGSFTLRLEDASSVETITLCKPNEALFIEQMVWRELTDFQDDTVILVLASENYDEAEYIRDYEEFKKLVGI